MIILSVLRPGGRRAEDHIWTATEIARLLD
jgi:hypothetical protein